MTAFSIGDSVRFKDGTQHADLPMAIGGWQGRITGFEANAEHLATVKLDSLTLQSLPELYIVESEIDGLSWSSYVEICRSENASGLQGMLRVFQT